MPNQGQDLGNLRIADHYTSLLHLSGQTGQVQTGETIIPAGLRANINLIYDGAGTATGISLSSLDDRVIINNYIAPSGYGTPTDWLESFYPIGSIIMTVNNNNPSGRIKGTRWYRLDPGRFFVGVGEDTVVNQSLEAQTYEFTPGIDGELLEQTTEDVGSGNIAGEYGVQLEIKHLPGHAHVTNMRTIPTTPTGGESGATDAHFIFYFGPQVNPGGLNEPVTYAFLEQDRIEAFQNNTEYKGEARYRTKELTRRHNGGYRYTNEDFNPTLGTFSLDGWGNSIVGGPGWAGIVDGTTYEYITDSPRPAKVVWPDGKEILRTTYDTRDTDRVHPGIFRDSQLLAARNLLISVLGPEQAKVALAGVDRLKELGETIEDQNFNLAPYTTSVVQLPGDVLVNSTNTGKGAKHNNIPPSYGAYFWVRVPDDFVFPVKMPDQTWTATITRDKVSSGNGPHDDQTNTGQFDLGEWAKNHGVDHWNGSDEVVITIAGADQSDEVDSAGNKRPVYIYSDDASGDKAAGMVIGDFPRGITLINKGVIMGRGGDGGSYGGTSHSSGPHYPVPRNTFRQSVESPTPGSWASGIGDGWDGGDAIEINSPSSIVIDNAEGAIAGGGGGGAGGASGNHGGGGGGAGGGVGGMGSSKGFEPGGLGGEPGQSGGDGRNWRKHTPDPRAVLRAGGVTDTDVIHHSGRGYGGGGGEAGGGGSGGKKRDGEDPNGGGGGGGRILSPTATGGTGGWKGGGDGGSGSNPGQSVGASKNPPGGLYTSPTPYPRGWGNGGGGGGWGADGGNYSRYEGTIRTAGGTGGKAITVISGSYTINGGIIYGIQE